MDKCRICYSYAINAHMEGRNDNVDLCDVCLWREKYKEATRERAAYGDTMTSKLGVAEARILGLEKDMKNLLTTVRAHYEAQVLDDVCTCGCGICLVAVETWTPSELVLETMRIRHAVMTDSAKDGE